jgi:hypothetical protein
MLILTENLDNILGVILLGSGIIAMALLFNILFDKKD